jgi:hypothetical protein
MMRTIALFSVIAFAFLAIGCTKDAGTSGSEPELYGTWAKGPNFGDTLQFMRKNNRNIMRKTESFNAAMPVYSETEYRFRDGKLSTRVSSSSQDYFPVTSFTWTQAGSEFTILGFQLYFFISSSTTLFTYRKI